MAVASTVTATILIPNRIKMKKLVLAICLYLLSTRRAISARSQDCRKTPCSVADLQEPVAEHAAPTSAQNGMDAEETTLETEKGTLRMPLQPKLDLLLVPRLSSLSRWGMDHQLLLPPQRRFKPRSMS